MPRRNSYGPVSASHPWKRRGAITRRAHVLQSLGFDVASGMSYAEAERITLNDHLARYAEQAEAAALAHYNPLNEV